MKILLAIDESDASQKAVRFAGEVLGNSAPESLSVTLFHVVESLPQYLLNRSREGDSANVFRQVAEEWFAERRDAGEKLLAAQKQVLLEAGLPETAVETKQLVKEARPEARKVVAALGIIDEMRQGAYEVVCLGRRGTSPAAGAFPGSVAEKVLRQAEGRTVWVVD